MSGRGLARWPGLETQDVKYGATCPKSGIAHIVYSEKGPKHKGKILKSTVAS